MIINKQNDLVKTIFVFLLINLVDCQTDGLKKDPPLMFLVSFDGFRWDYLKMYNLTNFNLLKEKGSFADFIYNSFATVTFPNHWTLVTGLYEETHGIIQNEMFDPILNKKFDRSKKFETREWFAQNNLTEPIWITNQKAGNKRKSAAEWIGANVEFLNQSIITIPYNHSTPYKEYIDKFMSLFTDKKSPINFGAVYFDEPDSTGHKYGPYSNEMKEKLLELDKILGYLIDRLKSNDLFDKMNLIITSDHGMESISNKTAIYLDSYLDIDLFDAYGSKAVYNLFVKNESNKQYVYDQLKKIENLDVYKQSDIPEFLHFKNNPRIGDIVVIARLGYSMFLQNQTIDWSHLNGNHGFYNNESSMFPIFIAHGPAFRKGFKIKSFKNVDLYPLMCYILDVKPVFNNGSINNLLDMLVLRERKIYIAVYVIICISPAIIASIAAICLVLISRKYKLSGEETTNNGYLIVSTNDTDSLINNDENTLVSTFLDNDEI